MRSLSATLSSAMKTLETLGGNLVRAVNIVTTYGMLALPVVDNGGLGNSKVGLNMKSVAIVPLDSHR